MEADVREAAGKLLPSNCGNQCRLRQNVGQAPIFWQQHTSYKLQSAAVAIAKPSTVRVQMVTAGNSSSRLCISCLVEEPFWDAGGSERRARASEQTRQKQPEQTQRSGVVGRARGGRLYSAPEDSSLARAWSAGVGSAEWRAAAVVG